MRGFTTIELIVVLVLTAIMAAVAMPRLTERTTLQQRGARDHVRSMLMYSRQVAMTQQREVCVLATPTQARAVYVSGGACSGALPLADPARTGPYQIDMPNGVALSGAALVRFNARGQLVPATDRTLQVGTLPITVSRETGLAL